MTNKPNVVIIFSRCCRLGNSFGVRFQERDKNVWLADWTFSITEKSAKKERYDLNQIDGTFGFLSGYPGCPFCEAKSLFVCQCGKVACWDGISMNVTCPWCDTLIQLGDVVKSLNSSLDR